MGFAKDLKPSWTNAANYREDIQGQLLTPLKAGQGYCVEFFISLAEQSSYAIRNLGIFFSENIIVNSTFDEQSWNLSFLEPQIKISTNYITDSLVWSKLTSTYIATGGEQYFCISNFETDDELDWTFLDSTFFYDPSGKFFNNGTYYFIDDVSIYECDNIAVPEDEIQIPNVFTPNGDGINDVFRFNPVIPEGTLLTIYNRWGSSVFETNSYSNDWDGNTKEGNPCPDGVYFYVVRFPLGTVKNGTVTIFR